jgi:tRNA-Thr(GGU) m(6)t(6)A37 methyltransferase TsaA
MENYKMQPIGVVHSVFKEKFGVPRQPGLAPSSNAKIELLSPYNNPNIVSELEQFSHLWMIFIFHHTAYKQWTPLVRPPRLGGNKKVGVFASRSTHRPNPIGMSVVKLSKVEIINNKVFIHINNVDLIDGTPILDIKPYIPYSDAIPDALAGYATHTPEAKKIVRFTPEILIMLKDKLDLTQLINEVLGLDPRPAYKDNKKDTKIYSMLLDGYDVKFEVNGDEVVVVELVEV